MDRFRHRIVRRIAPAVSDYRSETQILRPTKVETCEGCPLYYQPMVLGTGPIDSKIMVVGEAPHYEEINSGIPFSGRAGQTLNSLFESAQIDRQSLYITNALKCQIPMDMNKQGGKLRDAIEHCRKRLNIEIRRVKPKVVLALGDIALKATTGLSGISRHRGELQPAHETSSITPRKSVLPTFHPAFLLRGKEAMRPVIVQDLKKAVRIAQGETADVRLPVKYHSCTTFGQAILLLNKLELATLIAFDTETSGWDRTKNKLVYDARDYQRAKIFTIQFCWREREAWVLPLYKQQLEPLWSPTQEKFIWDRLKLLFEDPKKFWLVQNAMFDLRFLHQKGIDASKVRHHDIMLMQALVDENSPKDLESMALMYTDLGNYKTRLAQQAKV